MTMTQTQRTIRHHMDAANTPLHKVPFDMWQINEYLAFPQRLEATYVAIRFFKGHPQHGNMWFCPKDKYLCELHRDFLTGSIAFECTPELMEYVRTQYPEQA